MIFHNYPGRFNGYDGVYAICELSDKIVKALK